MSNPGLTDERALRRCYVLPLGYRVTFHWQHGEELRASWHPQFPEIRQQRAWRKFFAAYQAARRQFLTEVAAVLNGGVLVDDTDKAFQNVDRSEFVMPPTKQ
jgi:hypothetical protein